jgi:hypothetical protein
MRLAGASFAGAGSLDNDVTRSLESGAAAAADRGAEPMTED